MPLRILVVLPFAWSFSRPRSRNLWPRIASMPGVEVEVVTYAGADGDMPGVDLHHAIPTTFVPISKPRAVLRTLARGGVLRESLRIAYADAPAFRRAAQARIAAFRPDVVYVERLRGLRAVRGFPMDRIVLDPTDSLPLYYRQVRSADGVSLKDRLIATLEEGRLRRFEADVYPRVGAVVACTARDADAMAEASGRADIRIVANGVNTTEFFPPPDGRSGPVERLVMTGNFRMLANHEAAAWLVNEWDSSIREALGPEATLTLAGGNPRPELRQHDGRNGVRVTGFVPELREAYWNAGIAVAPVRLAVGSQNKIIEPMACGTLVVTTPEGAAGLPRAARDTLTIAPRDEMIEAIRALATDPARQAHQRERGLQYVRSTIDWDILAQAMRDIVEEVAAAASAAPQGPIDGLR